jgi:WD40 repeat protein
VTSPPPDSLGDGEFAVSPDGNRIVFSRSYAGNVLELYLLELAADLSPKAPPTRISWFNRYSGTPAWMPDGRSILFASGSSHNLTVWRMNVPPLEGASGKAEQVPSGQEGAIDPAVSRQGRIAYRQFMFNSDIWRLEFAVRQEWTLPPDILAWGFSVSLDARSFSIRNSCRFERTSCSWKATARELRQPRLWRLYRAATAAFSSLTMLPTNALASPKSMSVFSM